MGLQLRLLAATGALCKQAPAEIPASACCADMEKMTVLLSPFAQQIHQSFSSLKFGFLIDVMSASANNDTGLHTECDENTNPGHACGDGNAKRIDRSFSYSLLIKAQVGAKIKWT